MTAKLQGLKIRRVALVDKGANQDAFVELFKREPDMAKDKEKDIQIPDDVKKDLEDGVKTSALAAVKEFLKGLAGGDKTDDDGDQHAAELRKRDEEIRKANDRIAKLEEQRATDQAMEFTKNLGHIATADDFASVVKEARAKLSPEAVTKLEQVLKGAEEVASQSALFSELGVGGGDDVKKSAVELAEVKAQEIRKADPTISYEQAFVQAKRDPEVAAAFRAEEDERAAQRRD